MKIDMLIKKKKLSQLHESFNVALRCASDVISFSSDVTLDGISHAVFKAIQVE